MAEQNLPSSLAWQCLYAHSRVQALVSANAVQLGWGRLGLFGAVWSTGAKLLSAASRIKRRCLLTTCVCCMYG